MDADNDNLRTAVTPDGRALVVVDNLDRAQVETMLLYLFGLVDVIQTLTNRMVVSLAAGDLSDAQLATLELWRDAMNQVSEASCAEIQGIASRAVEAPLN